MNRRTFLKHTTMMGTALLGSDPLLGPHHAPFPTVAPAADERPNILIVLVDQLRYPQWFPSQAVLDATLPALARLRAGAVSFGQHYTAAAACTPARACLLTGLYAHQTGCLKTFPPFDAPSEPLRLQPGFPTWGTLLRDLGYQTYWWGKWHISASCDLEQYGFSGGTCPSPEGGPAQGLHRDPLIADQFISWLEARCTAIP